MECTVTFCLLGPDITHSMFVSEWYMWSFTRMSTNRQNCISVCLMYFFIQQKGRQKEVWNRMAGGTRWISNALTGLCVHALRFVTALPHFQIIWLSLCCDFVLHTVHEICKGKAFPLQTWTGPWGPGGWGSRISRHSAHEGSKVVSPTHRPSSHPGRIPGTHFCWRLSRSQGHNATGRIKSLESNTRPFGL
jgi:hypothetical protein